MRKAYVGVKEKVYDLQDIKVTNSNAGNWFTVSNDAYYFADSGGTKTPTNMTAGGTVAVTRLTAKEDVTVLVNYDYYSVSEDELCITIDDVKDMYSYGGTAVAGQLMREVKKGEVLALEFHKNTSDTTNTARVTVEVFVRVPITSSYTEVTADKQVRKIYVPVLNKKPVRETIAVAGDNIAGLFGVVNGTWGFIGRGAEFSANNIGVVSSAASTELTALMQMYSVSFDWLINAEDPYDRFTIAVNGTSVLDVTGVQSGSWSGSLNQGDKITFTYTKDVYGDAVGEYAIWKDMACVVDSTENFIDEYKARRVLKGYVGDDNGEAQLFFGKKDVSCLGAIANVSRKVRQAGAENKAAVLFSGGYRGWVDEPEVDDVIAFDSRLTRIDATSLPYETYFHGGATAGDGDFAVFAGGYYGATSACAYDEHLTQTILTSLSTGSYSMTPASFNGCAVFAGGIYKSGGGESGYVQYYDASLTFGRTQMSLSRRGLASAEVGGKLLLGGGMYSGSSSYLYRTAVDVFDENFTRTETELSVGRYSLAGGSMDGYALFLGGIADGNEIVKRVDAFDEDLTRYRRETLFAMRSSSGVLKAKTIDGMLLVTNGLNMEVWDDTLTALNAGDSTAPKLTGFDVGVIGDYMLISCGSISGGGYEMSDVESYIEAYKVK